MKFMVFGLQICLLVLILAGAASAEPWNGIVPYVSTRADVERKLGPCTEKGPLDSCKYRIKDQIVTIHFTTGEPCIGKNGALPSGTVTVMLIEIDRSVNVYLSDGGYDLSSFRVIDDPELPGWQYYSHAQRGIILVVESGLLREVHLTALREDAKKTLCPKR